MDGSECLRAKCLHLHIINFEAKYLLDIYGIYMCGINMYYRIHLLNMDVYKSIHRCDDDVCMWK